jgi:hypothetical protein
MRVNTGRYLARREGEVRNRSKNEGPRLPVRKAVDTGCRARWRFEKIPWRMPGFDRPGGKGRRPNGPARGRTPKGIVPLGHFAVNKAFGANPNDFKFSETRRVYHGKKGIYSSSNGPVLQVIQSPDRPIQLLFLCNLFFPQAGPFLFFAKEKKGVRYPKEKKHYFFPQAFCRVQVPRRRTRRKRLMAGIV